VTFDKPECFLGGIHRPNGFPFEAAPSCVAGARRA
jgi:hypothetical protein